MSDDLMTELEAAAWQARDGAVCPFSNFAVGAALRDRDGRVWTGANVENASYTLGLCAERVAIFHALTHGGREFTHVVVATDTPTPTSPCGACRQILWEFAPRAEVVMVARGGARTTTTVAALVPLAFDASALTTGGSGVVLANAQPDAQPDAQPARGPLTADDAGEGGETR